MFFNQKMLKRLLVVLVTLFIVSCSKADDEINPGLSASQNPSLPVLDVYKRASCGCCGKWVSHIENKGFAALVHNQENLSEFKSSKGIKPRFQSCHTAVSKYGYVFEGHIPAKFIQQFLKQKPQDAIGLAVPAMPMGSPGMEMNELFFAYKVLLLKTDGSAEIFAEVNSLEEQY